MDGIGITEIVQSLDLVSTIFVIILVLRQQEKVITSSLPFLKDIIGRILDDNDRRHQETHLIVQKMIDRSVDSSKAKDG